MLATVVFVDLLASLPRTPDADPQHCYEVIRRADAQAQPLVERFRGRAIRHAEDGLLVTFDGPARAVRFAAATVSQLATCGLDVRAGVHTGECDATGADLGGIAVQIARGVASHARLGEVVVSRAVHDLVLGSSITFEQPRTYLLDGVAAPWETYAVEGT